MDQVIEVRILMGESQGADTDEGPKLAMVRCYDLHVGEFHKQTGDKQSRSGRSPHETGRRPGLVKMKVRDLLHGIPSGSSVG